MTSDLQDIPEDASLARLLSRVILMESRLSALEGAAEALQNHPTGGGTHYQEALREFFESNLSKAQRERNEALAKLEVRDGKIVGLEEGLAAMTAERDDQYLRNTQLEWTKSDLIARNNSLMDTLKAERKARQEWDAANPPAPSPPDTGWEPFNPEGWTVEHTPTDICPPTEEEIEIGLRAFSEEGPSLNLKRPIGLPSGLRAIRAKKEAPLFEQLPKVDRDQLREGAWGGESVCTFMEDERKALYGEMARWLGKLSKEPGLLHFKSNIDDLLELVSRAEKAMEGESHDK